MKLKYNFVTNEVADKIIAIPVNEDLEEFNGFIKLNDIGAVAFNMLKNDVTEEEIVTALMEKFPEHSIDETKKAVSSFINKLKEENVIE